MESLGHFSQYYKFNLAEAGFESKQSDSKAHTLPIS